MLKLGELEIDPVNRVVRRAGARIELQDKTWALLAELSRRSGTIVPVDELHAALWPGITVAEHSLRQVTHRLRTALGDTDATLVQTVRGRGLRLAAELQRGPAHPVPTWPTRFVGRSAELAAIGALLAEPGIVSLIGMGGIGKSRLAAEVVRTSGAPVWFCALHDVYTVEAWITAVAEALGVIGAADRGDSLGPAIAGRGRCTVVLDGVERLVDGIAPIVGRWRTVAPAATFLVTSREPLALAGERWFRVAPLAEDDGLALLADRAGLVSASAVDPVAGRALVDRLDGLPLAIELAAARLSAMTAAELSTRLAGRLAWRGPASGAPAHHVTLDAVFAWSWDLLDPTERSAIGQCTVFKGQFVLAAAEQVVVTELPTADVLVTLVNRSWLQIERDKAGTTWYRMLDTVRSFVAGRVVDTADATLRWARHFAALGHRSRIAQASPAPMLADLVAAMWHGVAVGDGDIVVGSALGASSILFRHGPLSVGRELLRAALAVRPEDPWLLSRLSLFLADAFAITEGLAPAERAATAARASNDPAALTEALRVWGALLRNIGDDRAEPLLREALALAVEIGDLRAEQQAWLELARLQYVAERWDEAVSNAERVMALGMEDPDNWRAEYAARLVIAQAAAKRHDALAARHQLAVARELASGDPRAESSVDRAAGVVLIDLEEWEAAEPYCERAFASAEALGQPVTVLYAALALATVSYSLGRTARAEVLVTRMLAETQAVDTLPVRSGAIELWVENTPMPQADAIAHLEEALALARSSGSRQAVAHAEAALRRRRT